MPKTKPDVATPALGLRDTVAHRFPLVPRTRPVCRALDVRVTQVRELAQAASQRTGESLVRAAEAHNLAALIVSDCDLPALARDLCWQQFEVFRTARLSSAAPAKLALQPHHQPQPPPRTRRRRRLSPAQHAIRGGQVPDGHRDRRQEDQLRCHHR